MSGMSSRQAVVSLDNLAALGHADDLDVPDPFFGICEYGRSLLDSRHGSNLLGSFSRAFNVVKLDRKASEDPRVESVLQMEASPLIWSRTAAWSCNSEKVQKRFALDGSVPSNDSEEDAEAAHALHFYPPAGHFVQALIPMPMKADVSKPAVQTLMKALDPKTPRANGACVKAQMCFQNASCSLWSKSSTLVTILDCNRIATRVRWFPRPTLMLKEQTELFQKMDTIEADKRMKRLKGKVNKKIVAMPILSTWKK
ncbi:hypothetical protein E4U61_002202 [Claviceps capensis]|nr:hypothetical protein E4U61_002202 [Claviceps capensis]